MISSISQKFDVAQQIGALASRDLPGLAFLERCISEAMRAAHDRLDLSWAWIIVLLVVFTRVVLAPWAITGRRTSLRLIALRPHVARISAHYGSETRDRDARLLAIYRANRINPLFHVVTVAVQVPLVIVTVKLLVAGSYTSAAGDDRRSAVFGQVSDITRPAIDAGVSGLVLVCLLVLLQATSALTLTMGLTRLHRYTLAVVAAGGGLLLASLPFAAVLYLMLTAAWITLEHVATLRYIDGRDRLFVPEEHSLDLVSEALDVRAVRKQVIIDPAAWARSAWKRYAA